MGSGGVAEVGEGGPVEGVDYAEDVVDLLGRVVLGYKKLCRERE